MFTFIFYPTFLHITSIFIKEIISTTSSIIIYISPAFYSFAICFICSLITSSTIYTPNDIYTIGFFYFCSISYKSIAKCDTAASTAAASDAATSTTWRWAWTWRCRTWSRLICPFYIKNNTICICKSTYFLFTFISSPAIWTSCK